MSLRRAINEKCKNCTYDDLAPGTWRQQVKLCSVHSCPLWKLRPTTTARIPDSVLRWYGIDLAESQRKKAGQYLTSNPSSLPCEGAELLDSQTQGRRIGEEMGV